MMWSLAWRRHHESRMKYRVRQYYGGYAKDKPRHVGRIAHARKPCSCWMCGNPRRYFKERSLQERRALQPDTCREVSPDLQNRICGTTEPPPAARVTTCVKERIRS